MSEHLTEAQLLDAAERQFLADDGPSIKVELRRKLKIILRPALAENAKLLDALNASNAEVARLQALLAEVVECAEPPTGKIRAPAPGKSTGVSGSRTN